MKTKPESYTRGTGQVAEVESARERLHELGRRYSLAVVETVAEDMLDSGLLADVPVEWARANAVLPVRMAQELCVLTANPAEVAPLEHLALLLGGELRPLLAPRELILHSIERCYFKKEDTAADFIRDLPAPEQVEGERGSGSSDLLSSSSDEAPVTQLVNLILLEALKARASDIHFEPFESKLRVRYRIDGVLYEQTTPPKHLEQSLVSRVKVMARLDIAEKRLPQDGMARVRVGDREIDLRVSTFPVAEGERVVLRLLDQASALLPLSDLGLSADMFAVLEELLQESHGIYIVSGPTGSGKTTTLYAALQHLDTEHKNILTVEDPVEYQLSGIGQMQVKPKIGLTFAGGLRHLLRQDPDVILVGEIRDVETAEVAVRASLTGHLVFTTLHTNDAPSAAIRLIDMGVQPYLLGASLRAVLAQRLVRTLCMNCRAAVRVSDEQASAFGEAGRQLAGATAYEPRGCAECLGGYRGRTGLFELLVVTADVREQLRRGEVSPVQLRSAAAERGMPTLSEDGIAKILAGRTGIAEVLRSVGRHA